MTLISNSIRQAVVERAMNRCEYCRLSQESQVATFPVDHIIPVSLRGLTELENLALTCPRCNALKWIHIEAEEAETGEIVRLFNPRIDLWSDHFRWNEAEPARLDALTAIARATAVLLQLNAVTASQFDVGLLRLANTHPRDHSQFGVPPAVDRSAWRGHGVRCTDRTLPRPAGSRRSVLSIESDPFASLRTTGWDAEILSTKSGMRMLSTLP